jgi:hypothetical protein
MPAMRATTPRTLTATLVALAAAVTAGGGSAGAQGWGWWPWSQQQQQSPPIPREPIYRQPPTDAPGQTPDQTPGQGPGALPGGQPGQGQGFGQRANICLQLEQRLVSETQMSGQSRDLLPKIDADMRQLERSHQMAQAQLDRADCWDQFLFSRTLRRTPRCVQLNADVESMHQRSADLDAQRRQIMGRSDRSYQDDIIRELARNGCGQQYVQEARRRDAARNPLASLFGGEESDAPRGSPNQFGNLPFATYRTLCVRLCDGYYFPVSFSTLPNHFARDAEQCQAQCAAPAELYYHQNPGGAVEQMVSAGTQQPYTSLKTAWRYRKEYVPGCSCKVSEYVPEKGGEKGVERKAEAPASEAATATARFTPR